MERIALTPRAYQHPIARAREGIRGIVRMAQGMCRLAGRLDLAQRFRPVLNRTLRRLEEEDAASGSAEGAEGAGEEVSQETTS